LEISLKTEEFHKTEFRGKKIYGNFESTLTAGIYVGIYGKLKKQRIYVNGLLLLSNTVTLLLPMADLPLLIQD
jgi:hypothetical protein